MLIKEVPYYPVFMRNAHRINHHLNGASEISYVITQPVLGDGKKIKHYGR